MSTKQLKQAETAKEQKTKGSKKEQEKRNEKRNNSLRVRVFPIWLRIIIVIILAIFALVAGLMIGFGIIGDGNPIDALKVETWRHIIDIVIKE
ncbi:DNA-directed RNA polymerase subunit beta [Oceanobacillus alkalisoli]|uniref:DNA-directed RNA polymerase subunit beta n=2 Tax=Oceanobacillus alkalisoli TaxID=2925113 RepID=UPI001EE47A80|nr:DNA-directed RNA polymerase subunit beta [Oceanobacillus alkalisoli]MCG5102691.1 DNA-directed RNA polymerase subunit beta [Oceanobacillus alkalisoli]